MLEFWQYRPHCAAAPGGGRNAYLVKSGQVQMLIGQ
jgi:hypothetical protein